MSNDNTEGISGYYIRAKNGKLEYHELSETDLLSETAERFVNIESFTQQTDALEKVHTSENFVYNDSSKKQNENIVEATSSGSLSDPLGSKDDLLAKNQQISAANFIDSSSTSENQSTSNNDLLAEDQSIGAGNSNSSSAKASTFTVTRKQVPPRRVDWIVHANRLHVSFDEWQVVFDNKTNTFVTRAYPSLFEKKLHELVSVQCEMKAVGPYVSRKRYTLRMKCKLAGCCNRLYLLIALHKNNLVTDDGIFFEVKYNDNVQQLNATTQRQLLANGLWQDPSIYMQPKNKFIVAAANGMLLPNLHYNSVNGRLTHHLITFILRIFSSMRKDVQFEFQNADHLLGGVVGTDARLLKITNCIVVGLMLCESKGVVVILNTKTKAFSYLNTQERTPNSSNYFEQFKKFIAQHNKLYPQVALASEGWRNIVISKHPLNETQTFNDNGLFIVKYAKDLTESNKIMPDFDVNEFRKELGMFILKKSDNMIELCVMCGVGNVNEKMTKCQRCDRVFHPHCIVTAVENQCILCQL